MLIRELETGHSAIKSETSEEEDSHNATPLVFGPGYKYRRRQIGAPRLQDGLPVPLGVVTEENTEEVQGMCREYVVILGFCLSKKCVNAVCGFFTILVAFLIPRLAAWIYSMFR